MGEGNGKRPTRDDVPLPRSSPRIFADRIEDVGADEPKTDPGMEVDVAYLKRKLDEVATEHDKKMKAAGWLRTVVGTIAGTGVIVAVFLVFVSSIVKAQTDAGVRVHEERLTTLEQQRKEDRVENANRIERIEQNQNADHGLILGVSQKLDAVLRAQGIPNPAPAPKDGGR